MRLISLEIKNFRVIKSVKIEFPDKVVGIVGRNGAGKSSIIEAIAWALYGNQASRTSKDEIKSTFAKKDEICEVKVSFYINEVSYTVIRRLSGRTDRAEVELYRGESSESIGVNETKAYVGQLLGLDWRGFLSSFLARQSELNALSDLPPSKRRDHIAGMLGIQKLDKAIVRVKEDTKSNKDKAQVLEKVLGEKGMVENTVLEITKKIADLNSPIDNQKTITEQKEIEFKSAKSDFDNLSKQQIVYTNARAELTAQLESLNHLSERQGKMVQEQEQLIKTQAELDSSLKEKEKLKDIPERIEHLQEAKNKLELSKNLTAQQEELTRKKVSITGKLGEVLKRKEKAEKELSDFPKDLEKNLSDHKVELESKRAEYNRLKAEIEQTETGVNKLSNQLEKIGELKADSVCDRCLRPLGTDYQKIRDHILQEQEELRISFESKKQSLISVKSDGTELKKSVDNLENILQRKLSLTPELEALVREEESYNSSLLEVVKAEEKVVADLGKIGTVAFDPDLFKSLLLKQQDLQKIDEKINRFHGALERLPHLEEDIKTSELKIKSIKESIEKQKEKLEEIGFSEELFQKATEGYNRIQEELDTEKKQLFQLIHQQELFEKELQGKMDQLKSYEKSESDFETAKTAHYYGEKLGVLLSHYRQDLIASIRPSLADISSRLFNEMTGSKYNLVELDEKYELRVMDNGVFYGVERFSGGEKDLANLCLRLAISLALTESAGLSRSFVILDEVFGSQDNERKELILQALSKLKNRFPQIILISHVDDIKEGVEQVIEVIPTEKGYSEVRLNGA